MSRSDTCVEGERVYIDRTIHLWSLRPFRQLRGYTQRRLADQTEGRVSQARVSEIERGMSASPDEADALARALGITVGRLERRPHEQFLLADERLSA